MTKSEKSGPDSSESLLQKLTTIHIKKGYRDRDDPVFLQVLEQIGTQQLAHLKEVEKAPFAKAWHDLHGRLYAISKEPEIIAAPPVAEFMDLVLELVGRGFAATNGDEPLKPIETLQSSERGRRGGGAEKNPHKELALKLYDEIRPKAKSEHKAYEDVVRRIANRRTDAPTVTTVRRWVTTRLIP